MSFWKFRSIKYVMAMDKRILLNLVCKSCAKMPKVRKKKSSWSEMNEGARQEQGLMANAGR